MIKIKIYFFFKYVELLEDTEFYYYWKTIKIDKWFFFDGGSIPRILWIVSHPLYYKYLQAYLIHDYLYSNFYISKTSKDKRLSRLDADILMRELINNKIIAWSFYCIIRLFGGLYYWRVLEDSAELIISKKRKNENHKKI